jgi:hypothetical protein
MRANQILPRLNPAAPIALVADMAFAALAHQIDLDVPLTVPGTKRAAHIQIACPGLERDTVQGMSLIRPGAGNNALNM